MVCGGVGICGFYVPITYSIRGVFGVPDFAASIGAPLISEAGFRFFENGITC